MRKRTSKGIDDLRPEYDFSKLKGRVRGKHLKRILRGTNLVLLDPDVAKVFPDEKSVNEALRFLAGVVQRRGRQSRTRRAKHA